MTGSTRAGCDRVRPGRSGGVPGGDAAGDRAAAAGGAGHPSRSGGLPRARPDSISEEGDRSMMAGGRLGWKSTLPDRSPWISWPGSCTGRKWSASRATAGRAVNSSTAPLSQAARSARPKGSVRRRCRSGTGIWELTRWKRLPVPQIAGHRLRRCSPLARCHALQPATTRRPRARSPPGPQTAALRRRLRGTAGRPRKPATGTYERFSGRRRLTEELQTDP